MTRRGLVVARHRREIVIESDGTTSTALVRGRSLRPLTGDEVLWKTEADGTVIVEEILPRRAVLERIDSRGRSEGIAANLTLLVVVLAPRPSPDWQLLDRYLVAAATIGVAAAIVRNKHDLEDHAIDERTRSYGKLGYETVFTCTKNGYGIARLAGVLRGERSVLVGQSGVGKSSLLNSLLETEAQAVGSLSERKALGRHTTTASVLHRLPGGGEIIDSPGVRRYMPYIAKLEDLDAGFIEFRPLLGHCHFNDCRHVREPGCAILDAVQQGNIDDSRYRSYLALRATLVKLSSD